MKLQIGTYNVMHAEVHQADLNGVTLIDPEGIADIIAKNGAVICSLNEVDVNAKRSFYTHTPFQVAERLRHLTGERYYWAYAPSLHGHSGGGDSHYGNALLSKYPIKKVKTVPVDAGVGQEPRSILVAILDVEGTKLTFLVTHFGFGRPDVDLMLDLVKAEIDASEYPVVLMGDFNISPDWAEYDKLASWLTDSAAEDKFLPKTFPSDAPSGKIDFIFASDSLHPANARIANTLHSDHLPLFATIEWDD